ncbi:RING-type E3 ubiquitin transferase [Ranunculus cassubicifolius]
MPSTGNPITTLLAELALATGGIVVGTSLGYFAGHSFRKFISAQLAFDKIQQAKDVPIGDLRALLSSASSPDEKFVLVRGFVEASLGSGSDLLVSQGSGEKGVVLQESRGCITCDSLQELMETYTWRKVVPDALMKTCKYLKSTSMNSIPFILTGGGKNSEDYVSVSLDGSTYPLPFTRAFHQLEGAYLAAKGVVSYYHLNRFAQPVGLIEEMLLPLGKEVTAVGNCSLQYGNPQIEACQDFPYFLSDMTREEMSVYLNCERAAWFWSTLICGTLSVGILAFIWRRNWRRWRKQCVADLDNKVKKGVTQEL